MRPAREPEKSDVRAAFGILAIMLLGAGVFAVLFATARDASRASAATGLIGAAAVVVLAGLAGFVGARLGMDALVVALVLSALLVAGAATQVTQDQGQLAAGFVLVMLGTLTAFFVPGRQMWLVLGLELGLFGVALLLNPKMETPLPYVALCAMAVTLALTVSRVGGRLRAEADRDALTGVLNRHGFEGQAHLMESLARRSGQAVVIGYIDLDGFKHYNDVNGHGAGDRLLADLATAWSAVLRSGDLLVRWGGDEFLVLLVGPGEESADAVFDRMRRAFPVPWSVGLALWATDEDLHAAIDQADDALLAAKGQGTTGAHAHAARGPWPDRWSEPARMRAALASMLDPHFLLEPIRSAHGDVADFLIVDANDEACAFTTIAQGDLIGTCVLDLAHGTPPAWVMEKFAQTIDTGTPLVLDGLRYRDPVLGSGTRSLDVRAVRFSDALSVSWRDVTDRLPLQRRSGE